MTTEMKMQVTAELAVNVIPVQEFEYVMTTREVALGYGTSTYAVRMAMSRNSSEFTEGKHFIKGVTKCHSLANAQPHQVFWTKRGIVRLGFFIKSERAKLFRDWAEELIINVMDNGEDFLRPIPVIEAPKKRNHNRLSPARLVEILSDVAKIEDRELRLSLIQKLGV